MKLTWYVFQKEKLGLGHAVSLCDEFANGDPVLLVLGDQLYKSFTNKSCTEQFLDSYAKTNRLSISVCEVPINDVSKYGILSGKIEDNEDWFEVDSFVEKPSREVAEDECYTNTKNGKKYFAVFGEYILTDEVFKVLKNNISNGKKEKGEYQITSAIEECRKKDGDTIKIATITKKNGEIVLNKEDIIEECIGDICSDDTNSVEEKVEDFDETVNEYKKEGYTSEQK